MTSPEKAFSTTDGVFEKPPTFGDYLKQLDARIAQVKANIVAGSESQAPRLNEVWLELTDERERLSSKLELLMMDKVEGMSLPKGVIAPADLRLYDQSRVENTALAMPLPEIIAEFENIIKEQEAAYGKYQHLRQTQERPLTPEEEDQLEHIPAFVESIQKIISRMSDFQN